jgi:hypothetical protein
MEVRRQNSGVRIQSLSQVDARTKRSLRMTCDFGFRASGLIVILGHPPSGPLPSATSLTSR